MPVLTEDELKVCRNHTTPASTEHDELLSSAREKLTAFQRKITDKKHIAAVDALIPQAEQFAKKAIEADDTLHWNRVFCGEMTRLKIEKGLMPGKAQNYLKN